MRASVQEQTGTAGAHEVTADFERIGWGVADNPDHDLGTDLFLMARDHRRFDLGMLVGAQVKTGPTFFKEEVRDVGGNATGWWFREQQHGHFDAWINHQLPHIVVIRNLATRVSFWAHVTPESAIYTPKGAKIFVPAENVIDEANADKLLAVAAGKARQFNWEGSAWTGADLSPSQQLRHALLVPRLVAPHPNRGLEVEPTVAQVLAMVVQIRLGELARLAKKHESMPNIEAPTSDASWEWTFAASMRAFLISDDIDALRSCADAAALPHQEAAATVAYAAALLENGQPHETLELLDRLLAGDALDVVDHGWVQLQRARALAEAGRRREARDQALTLIHLAERAPSDVTAAAIGGAAAYAVFTLAGWGNNDVQSTVAALDTTAVWWRQQVSGWGLSAQADKTFRTWAGDTAVRIGGSDRAWRHLRSASLLAGLLGDHGAWRGAAEDLAVYVLSDPGHGTKADLVASALTVLRRSGHANRLELAARRVVANGPAIAAQAAVLEVNPEESTRTSAHADLRLLIEAADLLPADVAEAHATWAEQTFLNPAAYEQRLHPSFLLKPVLVDLMHALATAVGTETHERMAEFVLNLPVQDDQSIANRLAPLVRQLPAAAWNRDRAERAAARASADNWELTYALLEVAAPHVADVRTRLTHEAHQGSLNALNALGDVRALESDLVTSLINTVAGHVNRQVEEAAKGRLTRSMHDFGRVLALLNVWHPAEADWDTIYRLLSSTRWGKYLAGALDLLAATATELPADVADKLLPLADTIVKQPALPPPLDAVDPRPAARRLHANLERRSGRVPFEQLAALVRGDVDDRREAAILAHDDRTDLGIGVLMALAGDREPQVRAIAGQAIARRAINGQTTARGLLPALAVDSGTLVARALAVTVDDHPQLADYPELQTLRSHISATVRVAFSSPSAGRAS